MYARHVLFYLKIEDSRVTCTVIMQFLTRHLKWRNRNWRLEKVGASGPVYPLIMMMMTWNSRLFITKIVFCLNKDILYLFVYIYSLHSTCRLARHLISLSLICQNLWPEVSFKFMKHDLYQRLLWLVCFGLSFGKLTVSAGDQSAQTIPESGHWSWFAALSVCLSVLVNINAYCTSRYGLFS